MKQELHIKRSVFLRLFMYLSFAIFLITLVTGTLIYQYFNETLKQQAYNSNVEVLRQTKQIVEMTLQEVQQMAFSIALNKEVQNTVWLPWNMSEDLQVLSKVNQLFNDRVASSNYIQSIYLYSERADKVVSNSGIISINDFWDSQVIRDYKSSYEFSLWLDTQKIQFVDGKNEDVIRFVSSVPITDTHKNGILVINIKESLLYNAVVNINSGKLGNVAILNQHGDVLSYKDKKMLYNRFDEEINDMMTGQEGFFLREIEGKTVFVSYIISNFNGWKYVTLHPVDEVFKNSRLVIKATLIISSICLAIGLLMVVLISGKYYVPIRTLVRNISDRLGPIHSNAESAYSSYSDELSYISGSFDQLMEQNKEFREKFRDNELILKEQFLLSLVLGKTTDSDEINRQMDYYRISMEHKYYLVIIVKNADDTAAQDLSEQQKNLVSYQIRSLCEDIIKYHCNTAVVDQEQRHVALLLNLPAGKHPDDTLLKAKEIASELREALNNQLEIRVTIGIGRVCTKRSDIHLSYTEALEALLYERIAGAGSIISIADHGTDYGNKKETIALRNKNAELVAELKSGGFERAEIIIDAIFHDIQTSEHLSYPYKNFMLFQLVNSFATVILDMNGEIDEVFGTNYNLYHELGRLQSATQMRQWFAEVLQKTILFIQKKRENKNIELLNQVTRYIDNHCSETLSLQMVADHIYMNSTYLSKMFKEITGKMFSEYLSEVRMKKACALLTDTNKNVSEIAVDSGFGNKLNLIRTFKKQLGMTPTDYRKESVRQRLE